MARLPQLLFCVVTGEQVFYSDPIRGTMAQNLSEVHMSLSKLLLVIALICFILEALGSRMSFKAPFGLLGAGLAFLTAAFLFP